MDELNGILNLDKPAGMSSAAAVTRIKRLLPRGTKIGHAGTLDPFATGVLLLLIGSATKRCESLMDFPKQYQATVQLGATTETDDLTSLPRIHENATLPTADDFRAALSGFVGTVMQRPPAYRALKVGGRRAYDLARKGRIIELPPRPVRIDRIELLSFQPPAAKILVDCGRGTYIRAIARDLGEQLGCGGYLTQLCRTRIGPFTLEDAARLELLSEHAVRQYLRRV